MIAGRRYWFTARTRTEARERVRELLFRHRLGQLSPPQRMTLSQWASRWLAQDRWRPSTLMGYRQKLSLLLELLGHLRLDRLQPVHIYWALTELRSRGMGTRSLALAYAVLRSCLEDACRLGLIAANPCAQVPRPRHEKAPAQEWGLEEMRRFLRAALEDGRPLALMLALMLLTGLRSGEALGLRWEDVDLEERRLQVRRAVVWAGKEWHEGPPKSKAGLRAIALPSLAMHVLARLPRGGDHLFWQDRPPRVKQVSRLMAELCERAGVIKRPAHYLRHAHASLLAASGLDVKTLQRRLGHSQASITLDVYAHALSEMDRRAAVVIDDVFGVGAA